MYYKNRQPAKISGALLVACASVLIASCASTLDGIKTDIGGVLNKTPLGGDEASQNLVEPADAAEPVETQLSARQSMISSIQENLIALGYSPGPADGNLTAKTEAAIQDFQLDYDLRIDGQPSAEILELSSSKVSSK